MQKAPILRPEVTREMASAMCRPIRSWRTMIGRIFGRRGVFQQVVDRIAAEDLDPLALHDLRNRVTDLHCVSSVRPAFLGPKPRTAAGGVANPDAGQAGEPKESRGVAPDPTKGRCPLEPRQGRALGTLHWEWVRGRGRVGEAKGRRPARRTAPLRLAHTPPPPHPLPVMKFQRLRLWWGSRGQSPLAGFGASPRPSFVHPMTLRVGLSRLSAGGVPPIKAAAC